MASRAPRRPTGRGGARTANAPSTFESEMAAIDEQTMLCDSQSSASLLSPQSNDGKNSLWARPHVPPTFNSATCPLIFQQIEAEDELEQRNCLPKSIVPPYNNLLPHTQPLPKIQFYGVTEEGNSVLCHVHGFFPYFYVQAPAEFEQSDIRVFFERVNALVAQEDAIEKTAVLLNVELLMKESLYHFHDNKKSKFLKLTVSQHRYVNTVKDVFEKSQFVLTTAARKTLYFSQTTFESNIEYLLRFMIDADIPGMSWLELPADKYVVRSGGARVSAAQIEVDVLYSNIISHLPESGDRWSKIAPLRILSFDIECAGRKGFFPEASVDPVIQIANMVTVQGEQQPFIRNVLTLGTCAHITGCHVITHGDEESLLRNWSQFVTVCDPDFVTGYNILNFDLPYLLDRAKHLSVSGFPYFSRITRSQIKYSDSRFSSRAFGTRESKAVDVQGRIVLDLLPLMTREHKLRSYSLNAVSAHFLNEQKEDVHHSMITELQNGNAETRRRLAVYCLKDALLPQRLLDKLMCIINYTEMARVTGVPLNYLLTRGQQIKVVSQLLRKSKTKGIVAPALRVGTSAAVDETYEGATVIEPERGFYKQPIATLDFASLYPSIMIAHNLCYTTLLDRAHGNPGLLQAGEDYTVSPTGDLFVTRKHRRGLLPEILEDLISARKKAKADLKKETDPFRRAVLDGRQLALKISANSVYGFTGATIGKLPCLQISSTVTAFGRTMIEQTRELVQRRYNRANGYDFDSHVIYGDTDSVMVRFGPDSVHECMELGRDAAKEISKAFVAPIQLEFEKVYFPYLLINKKRYAGLYWTSPEKHDKMDCKGIETVRRDNCTLVAHVIDTCLRKILLDRDVEAAISFVKQVIAELLQNKIDMSQLVISKALAKSDYAGKIAHVELAKRMKKRDPGSAPHTGDRVAYVIIRGMKNLPAYERAEDPLYVLEHNLPIDTQYYLENQLSKPLVRIFEPILGSETEAKLLRGEHTRHVMIAAPTKGGLMKFAQRENVCLGCRAPLKKDSSGAVCAVCSARLPVLYAAQIQKVNTLETRYSRLWTQCQICQGSLHQEILCSANDCPIFYMRIKAQRDVKEAVETLDRYNHDW